MAAIDFERLRVSPTRRYATFGAIVGPIIRSPAALFGASIILLWVFAAAAAPVVAPYNPNAKFVAALADPGPSSAHWFGVDLLGRDVLSRVIWGARTVLVVAPLAVTSAYCVGCLLGLLAGYCGGRVDAAISRASDIILAFPVLILYIILITKIGPSALNIVVAVTISSSPAIGRIVRGLTLEQKILEYVSAAQMRRESTLYIMFVEILPNLRGALLVDFCLRIGYATITIGVLGFLGLGLPPPNPDWGGMIKEASAVISVWPHAAIFPCLAISSLVIGFNFLADGLREVKRS